MINPTLHDVALAAGVSDSTASRALRGTGRVSSSTRRKVEEAAHTLHFSLSRTASSLASGRTMRVPLVFIDRVNTWFNASVLEGCRQILAPHGYDVVPTVTSTRTEFDEFFNTLPGNRNADAIIVTSVQISESQSRMLDQLTVPSIGLDSSSPSGFNASVRLDNEEAMQEVARMLFSLGHRCFGYVSAPAPAGFSFSSQLRQPAFSTAIEKFGSTVHSYTMYDAGVINDYHSSDDAAAAMAARIVSDPHRPTAVCVESDEFAVSVMMHLRKLGIRVPKDLSIIGFDDSSLAPVAQLTTLHQSPVDMARHCASMALDLIQGKHLTTPHDIMRPVLIARNTTAPLLSNR
ncbi:LacI family transcriptional regulator [Bifidobacterium callitrichos]|nr:LacI family transcriptional regulator [Bifidobacterium callitrichos]